jgi:hypothetical protein
MKPVREDFEYPGGRSGASRTFAKLTPPFRPHENAESRAAGGGA